MTLPHLELKENPGLLNMPRFSNAYFTKGESYRCKEVLAGEITPLELTY